MKELSKRSDIINKDLIVAQEEPKTENTTPSAKNSQTLKTGDTGYVYTYILTSVKQRETLDLTKHKTQLEKVIKEFFGPMLTSIIIKKDRYTLALKEEFDVGYKSTMVTKIHQDNSLD